MHADYPFLIRFHRNIKFKIISRFARSKAHYLYLKTIYGMYQLLLLFIKAAAVLCRPLLPKIQPQSCDILVFANSKNHLKRSRGLWDILEKKGFIIKYYCGAPNFPPKFLFKNKIPFNPKVPSALFIDHAFARFLTQKYRFQLICDYHNFETASVLIKQELSESQKNIFIPHGKIRNSFKHSVFTFDYYLAFGESSLEQILNNPARLGSSKIVKTGSAFIPENFELPVCRNSRKVLFFSNWAVDKHPESNRGFEILINWAVQHPEYTVYIRLHPLENGKYVREKTAKISNMIVQDKSLSLKESLENVSIAIATGSNASIEAAILRRPSVVVLDKDYNPDSADEFESDSNFRIERFFPERARNADELHERITRVTDNYNFYLKKCEEYASYHIERPHDARPYMADVIEKIYHGREDFPFTPVLQNIETP